MDKQTRVVFHESSIPFVDVEWGRTKELVGKFSEAASEYFLLKITEYLPGYIHEKHVHPEQEETIFVLSGKGYSETEDGRVDLYPGCVCFIPAGVYHATCNPNEESMRVIIVKSPPDKDTVHTGGKSNTNN